MEPKPPLPRAVSSNSSASWNRAVSFAAEGLETFGRQPAVGINLMTELLRKSAAVLGDKYDVEIIEKHHNQKLDVPSGTALMLAEAVRTKVETDQIGSRTVALDDDDLPLFIGILFTQRRHRPFG